MSKKNKHFEQVQTPVTQYSAEYSFIKHDLVKVVVMNGIFLALVLAVYFTNAQSGYLDRLFSGIVK